MDEEAGLLRASRAKANVGRGRVLLALAVVLSVGGLAFAASRKATPNEFTNLGSTICPYNLEGGYTAVVARASIVALTATHATTDTLYTQG